MGSGHSHLRDDAFVQIVRNPGQQLADVGHMPFDAVRSPKVFHRQAD